jgi:hypothetical protein
MTITITSTGKHYFLNSANKYNIHYIISYDNKFIKKKLNECYINYKDDEKEQCYIVISLTEYDKFSGIKNDFVFFKKVVTGDKIKCFAKNGYSKILEFDKEYNMYINMNSYVSTPPLIDGRFKSATICMYILYKNTLYVLLVDDGLNSRTVTGYMEEIDDKCPIKNAIREINEETGLIVKQSELFLLKKTKTKGYFGLVNYCDKIFYHCLVEITDENDFNNLKNYYDSNDKIHVRLIEINSINFLEKKDDIYFYREHEININNYKLLWNSKNIGIELDEDFHKIKEIMENHKKSVDNTSF